MLQMCEATRKTARGTKEYQLPSAMATSSDFEERKLRKLSPIEKFFQFSNDHTVNVTVYCLTIATLSPLQRSSVHSVLLHLYRKLPNLRVCIEEDRNGELWLCQMAQENILLKWLTSPEDFDAVYIGETRKPHDARVGPLWRVTVMPAQDGPTPDAEFKHHYRVMFGLHHSITDGHSSMRLCGHFLSLLNSELEGNEVDDNEQFADYVGPEFHDKLVEEAKLTLSTNLYLQCKMRDDYAAIAAAESLLTKVFPPKEEVADPKTETLFIKFDEASTTKFVKKTKSEGVSVHSGFCSVLHSAFVELFQEAGASSEKFDIFSFHDVNERRYWNSESEKSYGPHLSLIRIILTVDKDCPSNVWESARQFHKVFLECLDNKQTFFMEIIDAEVSPTVEKSTDFYSQKISSPSVYSTSNMGNVTKIFLAPDGAEYPQVKATEIRRSTSLHTYLNNNGFCFQTFRGELLVSFDYNTRYISTELANRIVEKVRAHFLRHLS
ncbi:uncharacterized protein LOC108667723 [Hyalella azteca]|uniref:Uncharacterized protein LOC108667723 n=1 Tax=Hyalella azteca TaxID=294128 RepID=A0A8B7N8U8_HYAAZ|nr:uncharacterized protein LOC108667723 [Hyalella azteca]